MAATGPRLVVSGDDHITTPAPFVIEYSAEAIEQIRAETVAALLSIPYGGLEIAGVLFGKRSGNTVYVAARRVIECEHSLGPSFALSEKDTGQLEHLLAASESDSELAGFEALGWYVSHTRRPFSLVSGDVSIFDRFFSEPLKITGVVQPAATGKARFGWFVRNQDGSVDAQRPSSEFTIHPSAAAPPTPDSGTRSALSPKSGAIENRAAIVAPIAPRVDRKFSDTLVITKTPRQVRLSNRAVLATGLLAVIGAVGVLMFLRMRPAVVHPAPLHVLDTGTQLRIDWDPQLPVVQQARSGVLEIKEPSGDPVRIALSRDMLRGGSVFYDKPSSKVEVHLQLKDEKGSASESMVYFIGRDPESTKPVESQDQVAVVVEHAPLSLPAREPVKVPAKVNPPVVDKGSAERARISPVAARPFRPPVIAKKAPASESSLVEPPRIAIPQSQAGVALRTEAPVAAPPPVVIPPAVTPSSVAQLPKTPPQPTFGRLIWTGVLHKGAVLHLTDSGPSTGSLNGKLPGRPIKVSVHSAELLEGVIAVYTPDANSTRTAEAPGRRNGWNVTMYKFDPKHVHDLSLVETPAEDNNFKLGIKSNNRPVSIIVIDWRATN